MPEAVKSEEDKLREKKRKITKDQLHTRIASVGGRTMWAGTTLIWVGTKYPCWISASGRYLVIMDLDGLCPIYDSRCETESHSEAGTYELSLNRFMEACGLVLNEFNRIEIKIPHQSVRCIGDEALCQKDKTFMGDTSPDVDKKPSVGGQSLSTEKTRKRRRNI